MLIHTLQVGDAVLLTERIRIAVLAVHGDEALLEISEGGTSRKVVLHASQARAPRRATLTAAPGKN